jgi:uncharacterized protein (UPF0261 family)
MNEFCPPDAFRLVIFCCRSRGKPMVAVTAYGINSVCAMNAEPLLQERGYEMIAFHANGCGGMAMEEFIAQGLLAGVIDFTTHEIADEMFGGYCKGIGPARLEMAGQFGIPLVVTPGGWICCLQSFLSHARSTQREKDTFS